MKALKIIIGLICLVMSVFIFYALDIIGGGLSASGGPGGSSGGLGALLKFVPSVILFIIGFFILKSTEGKEDN
ncbi:hypothetical protein RFI36_10315 [Acinetobacter gerneri]|uniref:DUF1328 domain-containing protein n=1 Tax=Acinetobacter gerneri TaxID=202952 RepID=A0AAW8JMR7_9GAMM|nr:hypothetical protein [Acinetobacter gerneri]MDQ9010131.1 hypothetical protein [Acinetobacter gerneri]MDQ9014264.1 hypothetical protein [Acinetobacter gerneri]MDQ9025409.1 hypothetical protein [Acinetobacter gerneri]MDQ9052716.1 hypothetical protein [Acinetobacter gerneri]MDQ9060334.1 hypothetical protein [Acinetobacter gerneri]